MAIPTLRATTMKRIGADPAMRKKVRISTDCLPRSDPLRYEPLKNPNRGSFAGVCARE